jgi:hypothetical protein
MAWRLRPSLLGVSFGAAGFAACVFGLPLPLTVIVLVPASILATLVSRRAR